MKLGSATKLDTKNKTKSNKMYDKIMSANYDVIVIFLVFGQFGATGSQIPEAWFVKFTFSLIVTFYFRKTENRPKKYLHSSYTIALSKGTIHAKKY